MQAYKQRALAACGGTCPPRPAPCQVQVGAAAGEGEGESDVGGTRGHTWIMVARGRPRELIRPRRPRCILNSIEVYKKAYEDLKLHTPEHSSTQTGTIEATETATADTFFA